MNSSFLLLLGATGIALYFTNQSSSIDSNASNVSNATSEKNEADQAKFDAAAKLAAAKTAEEIQAAKAEADAANQRAEAAKTALAEAQNALDAEMRRQLQAQNSVARFSDEPTDLSSKLIKAAGRTVASFDEWGYFYRSLTGEDAPAP